MTPRHGMGKTAIPAVAIFAALPALTHPAAQITPQAAAVRLSFDVASVKLHKGVITFSSDPTIHGRTVISTASTLEDLIEYAFVIRSDQIVGEPAWALADHYDLEAKPEGEGVLPTAQSRQMVQSLLADRFQLKIHREMQEVAVYALVVAKGGPRFQPAAAEAKGGYSVHGGDKGLHLEAKRGTMEQLARQLSVTADRPAMDRTGLNGYYAFTLDWFPANRSAPPDLDAPDVFAALREQLGLRLEPAKAPVEKLVIDQVEKPSEN
jgi:uncharacterized protein (TIGR03435 family)